MSIYETGPLYMSLFIHNHIVTCSITKPMNCGQAYPTFRFIRDLQEADFTHLVSGKSANIAEINGPKLTQGHSNISHILANQSLLCFQLSKKS